MDILSPSGKTETGSDIMQRAWPRNHTYLWLQWREIWIFFYCWICTYTGTCIMSLIDFPAKRSTEPDSTPSVWLYPEGESAGQAVWYPEGEAVYEVYQQIWSPNHLLWVRWSHVSGQPSYRYLLVCRIHLVLFGYSIYTSANLFSRLMSAGGDEIIFL